MSKIVLHSQQNRWVGIMNFRFTKSKYDKKKPYFKIC